MYKNFTIILMILAAVLLSGCTGTNPDTTSGTPLEVKRFERANTNLDAKIVDVKFERDDIRAGEIAVPELFIANTGTDKITNETVEISAKLKTLDDNLANLYLKTMSDEKKTRSIDPINFNIEIEPGTIKSVKARFHTVKEMEGRSLAGSYEVTLTLSVNGQKIESRTIMIKLLSGEVREFTPTSTPVPTQVSAGKLTSTPTPTPVINETKTPKPTPTPTPAPVVAEPTGKIIVTRVISDKFTQTRLDIDAGDEVQWVNYNPDDNYDLKEMDGKIDTIVLKSRASYIFNTTGTYKFGAYYRNMRSDPSIQTITVKVNASK